MTTVFCASTAKLKRHDLAYASVASNACSSPRRFGCANSTRLTSVHCKPNLLSSTAPKNVSGMPLGRSLRNLHVAKGPKHRCLGRRLGSAACPKSIKKPSLFLAQRRLLATLLANFCSRIFAPASLAALAVLPTQSNDFFPHFVTSSKGSPVGSTYLLV